MLEQVAPLPPGRTISEAIAAALRTEIRDGQLAAGERLRQVELAKRFGVSTTPVREAFALLQNEGLVLMHPQRGATVFIPSREDLRDHYEIRAALEGLATQKAALKFTPADARPLRAVLDELQSCTDPSRYVELNYQFHMNLYAVAGSERLSRLIAGLRDASAAYVYVVVAEGIPDPPVEAEHRAILAACEAHDPDAAREAMQHHLFRTLERVMNDLADNPLTADAR